MYIIIIGDCCGHDMIVWLLDLQLLVHSVTITTKNESLKQAHEEEYLIPHYVVKFVRDLRQVCGFIQVFRFPPSNKLTSTI